MGNKALAMMCALRIEDGREWGEAASDFQLEDARAIFSDEPPHKHFLTRPRGGSKTTDLAGVAIAWLVAEAPPFANGAVIANNAKQAGYLMDAAAAFQANTPELGDAIVVENLKIVGPNGAWVEVLSQSASGAWGMRQTHLLVCDEFCQWDETPGARRVWTAIRSTVPKVKGCKLVILSSAGEPSHWSYTEVYEKNIGRPDWHFHAVPGLVPWMEEAEIESARYDLTPSQFQRLMMNEWSQDEDSAIFEEDYEAAARKAHFHASTQGLRYGKYGSGYSLGLPQPGQRYIFTVDVGISQDAAVIAIAHKEPLKEGGPRLGPQRVVIDHLERWVGSKAYPILVSDIEDYIVENAPVWNGAFVYADPSQFRGNIQNMNLRGVHAREWPFTATTVGHVASALVQTFRNRQIWVPDNPVLKDELLKVKLRSATAGVTRLDHVNGGHDDQAVCIGMACRILIGDGAGVGGAWIEHMKRVNAERLADPHPEEALPTPKDYIARSALPDTPRRCVAHRYFGPERRCGLCGLTPEQVAERDLAKV